MTQENSVIAKALWEFLKGEGHNVHLGLVPCILGNEWASVTHCPSVFYIGLYLTEAQHRATALALLHWMDIDDLNTTSLNRATFERSPCGAAEGMDATSHIRQ